MTESSVPPVPPPSTAARNDNETLPVVATGTLVVMIGGGVDASLVR
jgi:hypothetical protein